MKSLAQVSRCDVPPTGVLCVALAHNEMRRAPDFLRHHRELGVAHFFIVDDHSSDGTREYFQSQTDVTLFLPNGTTYKHHKALWRKEILDAHALGRWVLLIDLDEQFIYPHCDSRSVDRFAAYLESEGSEAVFAPMVEMYADHSNASSADANVQPLVKAFPFFDAEGYRLLRPSGRFLKKFPTPPLELLGGPRERLFYDFDVRSLNPLARWVLRTFSSLDRSMKTGALASLGDRFARLVLRGSMPRPPLVMSKIPLLKWRKGLQFPGGPHAVSDRLPLSQVWGALLHFKFMDFVNETKYRAARGQHAKEAVHYKLYEEHIGTLGQNVSPYFSGSRRYGGWQDLATCGLLRSTQKWDRYRCG